jgi:hypothetical protein
LAETQVTSSPVNRNVAEATPAVPYAYFSAPPKALVRLEVVQVPP